MPYKIINAGAYLDSQVKAGILCREDADLIREFCEERKAIKHISESTALVTSKGLSKFAPLTGPFRQCSTQDIIKAINAVEPLWRQNTRRLRVYYLKEFCHWLIEEKYNTTVSVKKLDSIKPPTADKATKTASQMIPDEKIDQMIRSCKNPRDRALIAFMYEGALRPIEVRTATWEQLKFDLYGAVFNTSKKTGKPRYIRFIKYAQYLAAWKAGYHPGTPEGDALVFVTGTGKILSRQYFDKIIKTAAETVDLKGVFPYILRHSRITAMVAQEIPESVIKLQAWGNIATPMMATYTHLSNDRVDDILLGKAGIKRVGRPKGPSMKPVQCPHCSTVNVPGAQFCYRCGRSLTEEAESEEDEVRRFAKSPPLLRMLADELEREQTKTK
ncbi:MAG TPA: site-specific integrase [Methanoregula sp.]|nr:site-specific integrase [Methanoregula sp.]